MANVEERLARLEKQVARLVRRFPTAPKPKPKSAPKPATKKTADKK